MSSQEDTPRQRSGAVLGVGTAALARRVAEDATAGSATPFLPPLLDEERAPRFVVHPDAGGAAAQPLLRAWKDSRVHSQTHVAVFVILGLAGLALGIRLGL